MKKIIALLMIVVTSFVLIGCELEPSEGKPGNGNNSSEVKYEINYTSATLHENSIGTIYVNAIAEVENTGTTDLYLSAGSFDLENEEGKLVKVINLVSVFPQIISPGEKAYYHDSTSINEVSKDANLTVILNPEIKKAKVTKKSLPVTEVSITDTEYFGLEALGRVENTTDKDDTMIYVAIVIFGKDDRAIGVLFAIEEVNAGAKKGFKATSFFMSSDIVSSDIKRHESFGYSYQFQF